MPPLNRLSEAHFLGLLDYTPQWNCQPPKFPDNNDVERKLNDISIQVADLEDGAAASRDIDNIDLNLDQEFYEYHQLIESKMSAFWEIIRNTIRLTEGQEIESLSQGALAEMVSSMLDELVSEAPEAMYMKSNKGKIYYRFYDLFEAWGLDAVVFFPDMSGSSAFIHDNYADRKTRVSWHGSYVRYTHDCHTMTVVEDGVRCSMQKSSSEGKLIPFSSLEGYFKNWRKPEKEEVNLFKMLHPEMGYNIDIIRAGCARCG